MRSVFCKCIKAGDYKGAALASYKMGIFHRCQRSRIDTDEKSLLQAVTTAVNMNDRGDYGIPVPNYVEENVSTKVVKIIQSYTGVVNKMVWRKF